MIVGIDDLAGLRERHQGQGLVLTSGTFDLFHVGHLASLGDAKEYGDVLMVLLSGDARVRARKGSSRPVIPENHRAQILDALKIVDYVLIDPSGDPSKVDPIHAEIIKQLQPDLYVTDGPDPRFAEILGNKLIVLPDVKSARLASTSAIIQHIIDTTR